MGSGHNLALLRFQLTKRKRRRRLPVKLGWHFNIYMPCRSECILQVFSILIKYLLTIPNIFLQYEYCLTQKVIAPKLTFRLEGSQVL